MRSCKKPSCFFSKLRFNYSPNDEYSAPTSSISLISVYRFNAYIAMSLSSFTLAKHRNPSKTPLLALGSQGKANHAKRDKLVHTRLPFWQTVMESLMRQKKMVLFSHIWFSLSHTHLCRDERRIKTKTFLIKKKFIMARGASQPAQPNWNQ